MNEAEEHSVVAAHTHLHSGGGLLPQLGQVLVAFLNLLVQALVLNLELLKVNEVQPLRQLLLQCHQGWGQGGEGGLGALTWRVSGGLGGGRAVRGGFTKGGQKGVQQGGRTRGWGGGRQGGPSGRVLKL